MPDDLPPALRCLFVEAPDQTLSWHDVMSAALYHSDCGYYAGGPRRIGRGGDFYTAVSVGPLYGRLLAEQVRQSWERAGRPQTFIVAEQAAHDGQLMDDLMHALESHHPDLWPAIRGILIEPQPAYRSAQEKRLHRLTPERLQWIQTPADLPAGSGLLVCNELLDALPVHRVQWDGHHWAEQCVRLTADDDLEWTLRPITDQRQQAEIARIPTTELPIGYTTETHLASIDWLHEVSRSPFIGELWIADYGLDLDDYYTAERTDGTLRRYFQHQMDGKVLEQLTQADLTSHICFTRLIEEAASHGRTVVTYQSQGRVLTHLATPWLKSLEGSAPAGDTAALIRQFQSLTHPAHMGKAFRILLLSAKSATL